MVPRRRVSGPPGPHPAATLPSSGGERGICVTVADFVHEILETAVGLGSLYHGEMANRHWNGSLGFITDNCCCFRISMYCDCGVSTVPTAIVFRFSWLLNMSRGAIRTKNKPAYL